MAFLYCFCSFFQCCTSLCPSISSYASPLSTQSSSWITTEQAGTVCYHHLRKHTTSCEPVGSPNSPKETVSTLYQPQPTKQTNTAQQRRCTQIHQRLHILIPATNTRSWIFSSDWLIGVVHMRGCRVDQRQRWHFYIYLHNLHYTTLHFNNQCYKVLQTNVTNKVTIMFFCI